MLLRNWALNSVLVAYGAWLYNSYLSCCSVRPLNAIRDRPANDMGDPRADRVGCMMGTAFRMDVTQQVSGTGRFTYHFSRTESLSNDTTPCYCPNTLAAFAFCYAAPMSGSMAADVLAPVHYRIRWNTSTRPVPESYILLGRTLATKSSALPDQMMLQWHAGWSNYITART